MARPRIIIAKSLKEQVYDYLRECLQKGTLEPGSLIDVETTCRKLGVSKTPLREALLQLEMEDFVTILPRRGVVVNPLTLDEIRSYYEIIGALEAKALAASFDRLDPAHLKSMESLADGMDKALAADNFDLYYERNLRFHDVYLKACGNPSLVKVVQTVKKRLYDFPRRVRYVKEWETASVREHRELLRLIGQGRREAAVRFIEDVHWSFRVQEPFIRRYYAEGAAGRSRGR
jgi:DNA-binding GntR family transcriptional regulator